MYSILVPSYSLSPDPERQWDLVRICGDGSQARHLGIPLASNPHEIGSEEHRMWSQGWEIRNEYVEEYC